MTILTFSVTTLSTSIGNLPLLDLDEFSCIGIHCVSFMLLVYSILLFVTVMSNSEKNMTICYSTMSRTRKGRFHSVTCTGQWKRLKRTSQNLLMSKFQVQVFRSFARSFSLFLRLVISFPFPPVFLFELDRFSTMYAFAYGLLFDK
jgi:hypothetical protein